MKTELRLHQPPLREEHVVREIMERLAYSKIRVWRIKERVPDMRGGRKFFRGGASTPGVPDLIGHIPAIIRSGILFSPARPLYIEVKRPGGKKRLMQKIFIDDAVQDGAIAFFADSWESVRQGLIAHGVELDGKILGARA